MPAVDDLLADLAAHPPSEPTPVDRIRARARRRTRRRRALVGAAAVLVVAAAGIGVGAVVTADDPGEDVVAGPTTDAPLPPSSAADPGSTTTMAPQDDLVLEPAAGFEDGTVVVMALAEPASGPAVVAQCASEALDAEAQPLDWCRGLDTTAQAEALLPYRLDRTVETVSGTVDCAEAPGRCVLGVRVGGTDSTDDRWASLSFASDLPPVGTPVVDVDGDEGTVGDGDTLLIDVEGVDTGDAISVQQCRTGVPAPLADGPDGSQCATVRSLGLEVQDGPETQLAFTAFHDIFVTTTSTDGGVERGWVACEPCELVVWAADARGPVARVPLVMEPTDDPIRPALSLSPAGPYDPGQTVEVRATGLQRSAEVEVGVCPADAPQGGGGRACWGPDGEQVATAYRVGSDGSLVIDDFVLPAAEGATGYDCVAVPGTCGIGIDVTDGVTVIAFVPLDLSG